MLLALDCSTANLRLELTKTKAKTKHWSNSSSPCEEYSAVTSGVQSPSQLILHVSEPSFLTLPNEVSIMEDCPFFLFHMTGGKGKEKKKIFAGIR